MHRVIFCFIFSERAARGGGGGGGGGGALPDFLFFIFSLFSRPRAGLATVYSSFFGLATSRLNVRSNNNNNTGGMSHRISPSCFCGA